MHIGRSDTWAELWASLLSQSCTPVLRVPELRPALRWWRAAAGARVVVKGRLGDLRIAVLDLERHGGTLVVLVGGPGALEADTRVDQTSAGVVAENVVDDPWGNAVVLEKPRSARAVSA